ncbi:unnamed protein product [Brassica oleracea]
MPPKNVYEKIKTSDKPYINPKEITVIVLSVRISKLTDLIQPLDSLYIIGYNVLLTISLLGLNLLPLKAQNGLQNHYQWPWCLF